MLISHEHQFLFVHVQKTAGTAVRSMLTDAAPDVRELPDVSRHAGLGQLLKLEPRAASYFIFGFVRNPWSRMLSWYRMVERLREDAAAGREASRDMLEGVAFLREVAAECPDFEYFVMTGPERWRRLRVPQVRYLSVPGGGRRADFIGRQETFEADLQAVFARLGLPLTDVRERNVDASRPDYREVYTDRMRKRVGNLFEKDCRAFGYEF